MVNSFIAGNKLLQKSKIIIRYQSSNSDLFSRSPAEAGRAEDVVRCVANLEHKGGVENITFNSSHVIYKRGKGFTYEVKFSRPGSSRKKRFTVYRLSGIHAKSECYQVTDPQGKYIVVKIPPQPIREIDTYLDAVVHERILAKKLLELGVKVVVPGVSSVMRHLHKFESANGMSPTEMEDAYMDLLRNPGNPFAEYLKIDGSFVFFVEFLDDPFLGSIVREFYQDEILFNIKRTQVESDFNLLRKHNRLFFFDEYKNTGTKQSVIEIYSNLLKIYESFSVKVETLAKNYFLPLDYAKIRSLFVANAIGELIDEASFPESNGFDLTTKSVLLTELNNLIDQETRKSPSFTRYLEILDQEKYWLAYKHSSRKIKMIGDNLLALLVKLEGMGLALRDLKVDNLFITDVENMELGVIDLETGGDIGSENIEGIVPAGMPSNMTVSNLLFVNQLKSMYGDSRIAEILHIQDWYATVAIMFEAITGVTLFDDARDYLLKVNNEIDIKVANDYCEFLSNNPGVEVTSGMIEKFFMLSDEEIKGHTWNFFALAKRDLKKKSYQYNHRLKDTKYCVPDDLKKKVLENIEVNLGRINDEYKNYNITDISGTALDPSVIPVDILKKNVSLKEQLYNTYKANPSVTDSGKRELAVEIERFKGCMNLKRKESILNKKKYMLRQEQISAWALFPIMLDYIIEAMCQDDWHQYRPRFVDSKKGREIRQTIGAVAGWKSTIVPTKEELAKWARKSRKSGFNNLWPSCYSLRLPLAGMMSDTERTLPFKFNPRSS